MICTYAAAETPLSCHRHRAERRNRAAVAAAALPPSSTAKLPPPSCRHHQAIAKMPSPSHCALPPLCCRRRSTAKLPPPRCCRRCAAAAALLLLRQDLMVLEYQVLAVQYRRPPKRKSAGGIPYFHVISLSPSLRILNLSIEIFVWRSRELLLIILTNISRFPMLNRLLEYNYLQLPQHICVSAYYVQLSA